MEAHKSQAYVMLSTGKSVAISTEPTQQRAEGEEDERVTIEKVHNVWGSSSGARSDFFDIYCKNRNTELQRLEELNKQWKDDMENKVFQTIRYTRMQKEQHKLEKRKERRNKRKMKGKGKFKGNGNGKSMMINKSTQEDGDDEGEDEEDDQDDSSPVKDNKRQKKGPSASSSPSLSSGKGDRDGMDSRNSLEGSTHADDDVVCKGNDGHQAHIKVPSIVIHDELAEIF